MDFIIFGVIVLIILLIIRIYNYYNPKIDFVLRGKEKSIVLWYSYYDKYNWEKRKCKTIITF
jgi:hypothetical protein